MSLESMGHALKEFHETHARMDTLLTPMINCLEELTCIAGYTSSNTERYFLFRWRYPSSLCISRLLFGKRTREVPTRHTKTIITTRGIQ